MANTETHKSYLKHSPAYAAAYARYGRSMPVSVASLFAKEHGFTLADLAEDTGETVERGDQVDTLNLFLTLGY